MLRETTYGAEGPTVTAARFVDERSIPTKVDVLIVGSGPVGATYARVISDRAPGARILMVEAGPRLTEIPGVHVRNIDDAALQEAAVERSEGLPSDRAASHLTAHFNSMEEAPAPAPGTSFVNRAAFQDGGAMAAAAMSRNVGGMGCHWAGAAPTPRASEREGAIAAAEWPGLLQRAQSLLAVSDSATTDDPEWAEFLRRLSDEFDAGRADGDTVRNMPLARQEKGGRVYWTGPDVILDDLATAPRDTFSILSDTLVCEIIVDGKSVGGAVLEHQPSGTLRKVDARVVVVAADSLHTPQLLWKSGVRPEALGRHLNDHTMVGALMTPEYLDAPGDPAELFAPTRSLNNVTDAPSSGMAWLPNADPAHPIHGQFAQALVRQAGGAVEGVAMVGFMLAKESRSDDRVWFNEDATDDYGMPEIRFDYSYTATDRELQAHAARQLERIGAALGVSDLNITTSADGMSLHYLGTTRMGAENDGSSVCDSTSKVWGYDNLFVGGNGVISTPLACNPTLTTVALASRGADAVATLLLS